MEKRKLIAVGQVELEKKAFKPGSTINVGTADDRQWLVDEGAARWEAEGTSAIVGDGDLHTQDITMLIEIAIREGIISDPEEMRLALADAILSKRSGNEIDWSGLAEVRGEDGEAFDLPAGDIRGEPQPLNLSDEERANLPPLGRASGEVGRAEGSLANLDRDGDGHPGGSLPADQDLQEDGGLKLTDKGGGWFHITGADLTDPVKIRGEDAAKARFAEMVAAADEGGDEDGEGDAPA